MRMNGLPLTRRGAGRPMWPPADWTKRASPSPHLGLGLDHRVLDRRERDLAAAELQARDADAPAARVAALGDRAVVVDLDPGLELVGLAEEVVLLHRVEVEQPVERRLVVVGDAPLERQLRHALDRLGRDPGDGRDRRLDAHRPSP